MREVPPIIGVPRPRLRPLAPATGVSKDEPFGWAGRGRTWFPGTTRSVFARFVPSPQAIPALKPFAESWHFSIPALFRCGAVRLVKPDSPRS